MIKGLDLVEDPVFDKSVILDSIRLFDPILIDNKLGDTNKGVPGRLLGKHQFYMDIIQVTLFSTVSKFLILSKVHKRFLKRIFFPQIFSVCF